MKPRTYTGPAKPISLDPMQHSPWQRMERVFMLLCLMGWAFDMFISRPN